MLVVAVQGILVAVRVVVPERHARRSRGVEGVAGLQVMEVGEVIEGASRRGCARASDLDHRLDLIVEGVTLRCA